MFFGPLMDTPSTFTNIDPMAVIELLLGFLVFIRVAESAAALVQDVPLLAILQLFTTLVAGVAISSLAVLALPGVGVRQDPPEL